MINALSAQRKMLAKQRATLKIIIRRLEFFFEYKLTGLYAQALARAAGKSSKRTAIKKIEKSLNPAYLNAAGRRKLFGNQVEFIRTREWRELREQALSLMGNTCMKCSSSSKINVDHIKPKSKYPELALDINNLQILCWDCNKAKNNIDETDYRKAIQ